MPLKTLLNIATLIIADDHSRVRQAWVYILSRSPGIQIVAECSSGEEAVKAVQEHAPDVILMDINMYPMDGFQAAEEITKSSPSTKIIGMSIHNDLSYVNRMLKVGASGYVTKNSSSQEMVSAIEHAKRGEQYICSEIRKVTGQ
jgi:DNA-binding NarL/FixJ family response regulator